MKKMKGLSGIDVIEEPVSVETSHEASPRTLFFDFGSISIPLNDWRLVVHAWTATGQAFYRETRETTVDSLDGVLFVADAQNSQFVENLQSWKELRRFFGIWLEGGIPVTTCLNKKDLPRTISRDDFFEAFPQALDTAIFETVATKGMGVQEAFMSNLELILVELKAITNMGAAKFLRFKSKIKKALE